MHLPKIILLLAIENGIEIDSVILILSNGFATPILTDAGFVGELGTHSRIFDMIRL